jgi:hypothetical protein
LDGVLEDVELPEIMRRANLDAFWEMASTAVSSNLRAGMRAERTSDRLGMPSLTLPMGPFPLEDSLGMCIAVVVLDWSLDPGTHDDFVQWETFRRARLAVTNISQAGVSGLGALVGAYERQKMWIFKVVTHSLWFSRFMSGLHKRVGDVKKRGEAMTIGVVHAIQVILHAEWGKTYDLKIKGRIAEMGTWGHG